MQAPLGRMIGNALEVIESMETLKGRGPSDVEQLSVHLAARMLVVAGIEADEAAAEARVRATLASGAGVEMFGRIVENQGGDPRAIDDYARLPSAPDRARVAAPAGGYVVGLEAEAIGRAAVLLGAGRSRLDDRIDAGVGIEIVAPLGTQVGAGDPVLLVHHRGGRGLDGALPLLTRAVRVAAAPVAAAPLVLERTVNG
jgi:thymidine phosphorylase